MGNGRKKDTKLEDCMVALFQLSSLHQNGKAVCRTKGDETGATNDWKWYCTQGTPFLYMICVYYYYASFLLAEKSIENIFLMVTAIMGTGKGEFGGDDGMAVEVLPSLYIISYTLLSLYGGQEWSSTGNWQKNKTNVQITEPMIVSRETNVH